MAPPFDTVRLSRFLSLVLRHDPAAAGVGLDPEGWAGVDELIAGVRATGRVIDRETLYALVRDDPKRRYALAEDGARIRANQGHSVAVSLGLVPVAPPDLLYHGTVASTLASIAATGLERRSRRYVHLSPDVDTARAVGRRRGAPVVLPVRAGALHAQGRAFYRSENEVWLTDAVPPGFIAFDDAIRS